MPCYDGRDNVREIFIEKGTQTSRLCAVFKVLEQQHRLEQTLDACDWVGSGVSKKSTLEWWERHKREDQERIEREQDDALRKQKRAKVIAKLSKEELRLLNINKD